jgi:1,4-dihydroxy-2-naphthoate octaprenyltransferase
MKKKLINTLAALAVVGGLILSAFAPWWVVWFICFPCIFAGVVYLLSTKTDYLKNY